jgi:hypothetical protein
MVTNGCKKRIANGIAKSHEFYVFGAIAREGSSASGSALAGKIWRIRKTNLGRRVLK